MWWWTRSSGTGWKASKQTKTRRRQRGGRDISRRFSTRMTEWSARRTPNGSRALSAPWSSFSTGWACWLMSTRQSAWPANPVGRGPATGQQTDTGGGLRGRDYLIGSGREREWRAGSVGWKSRPYPCRVTWWLDMGGPHHGGTSGLIRRLGGPGHTR